MKYKLIISTAAENDFSEIIFWYAKINSELSERFKIHAKQALEFSANSPFSCPTISKYARHISVSSFPYRIVFIVKNYEVIIIAILHHKRSPSIMQNRIKNH